MSDAKQGRDERQSVRSVERALDVLLSLTDGERTLTAIAATTDLSKATVHRLLTGLSSRAMVSQDPASATYMLGPGCFPIALAVNEATGPLSAVARPHLEALRDHTGETVTIHVRTGTQRVCVAEVESKEAIRYTAGVGAVAPVHTGAAGKALLAFLDAWTLDRLLDAITLDAVTPRTITDHQRLRTELKRVRARGWAESRGERVLGARAVSAPIRVEERLVGAISVLGPEVRLTDRSLRAIRGSLLYTAGRIAEGLGGGTRPMLSADRT